MSDPRWHRLQEIFLEARALDVAARERLLAERCAGDAALLDEVRSLLAADHSTGPLDAPLPRLEPLPQVLGEPPARIGAWRLLHELGRGGMGVVYLAERADGQYEQRVAIKLIAAADADDPQHQRFRAERQILAGLSHPHIARLLDGGVTPEGQPYIVLEYVDGVPVTAYCDERRLTVAERLRLFLDICAAVQHAHARLVIHRDLKPGNILVGDDGRVHLLDFGIAKLLQREPVAGATPTRADLRAMTPEYASPEQVRGDALTTATDIYSLGVLLYELLCGSPPYALNTRSPLEVAEVVCRQDPERPSVRVTRLTAAGPDGVTESTPQWRAAARGTTVERLRRQLRGDLDSIVMLAMRKEPQLRYASVEALRDDVVRHLTGRPVHAHRGTGRYRMRKFMLRHRTAVAASAIAATALITGAGAAGWQAMVAGRERDRAAGALAQSEELTSFLMELFRTGESDGSEPRRDVTAADLLRRGVARAGELADRPVVQARLLDVIGRMSFDLGQYDEAQSLLEQAVALRRAADSPLERAESLIHLARVHRARDERDTARTLVNVALALRSARLPPDDPLLASTLYELSFFEAGPVQERLLARALEIMRAHGTGDPLHVTLLQALATNLRRQGRYPEALRADRDAVQLASRDFGANDFRTGEAMVHLADQVADLEDDDDAARQLYMRGIELIERRFGTSSIRLLHGLGSLARLHARRGEHDDAERLLRRALDIRVAATGPDHPQVAASLRLLAAQLGRQGKLQEAETTALQALEHVRRTSAGDRSHALALATLAEIQSLQARHDAADRSWTEVLALNEASNIFMAEAQRDYARQLIRRRRFGQAETLLLDAHARMDRHYVGTTHPNLIDTKRALMELYDAWGRPDRAATFRVPPGRHITY